MYKLKIDQIFRYLKDKERDKPEIDGYPNFLFLVKQWLKIQPQSQ